MCFLFLNFFVLLVFKFFCNFLFFCAKPIIWNYSHALHTLYPTTFCSAARKQKQKAMYKCHFLKSALHFLTFFLAFTLRFSLRFTLPLRVKFFCVFMFLIFFWGVFLRGKLMYFTFFCNVLKFYIFFEVFGGGLNPTFFLLHPWALQPTLHR